MSPANGTPKSDSMGLIEAVVPARRGIRRAMFVVTRFSGSGRWQLPAPGPAKAGHYEHRPTNAAPGWYNGFDEPHRVRFRRPVRRRHLAAAAVDADRAQALPRRRPHPLADPLR